ncbi:MAG: hypothetical protein ACJZ8O_09995 [Pirellulaceae bacterium]
MNSPLYPVRAILLVLLLVTGCSNTDSSSSDPVKTETPDSQDASADAESLKDPQVATTEKAPTKEEIVEAHLKAMGGVDVLKTIQTVVKVSAMQTQDVTGSAEGKVTETFDLVADLGRIDLDLGTYQESKGWRKQQGWKQTSAEPLRALTAEELALDKIGMPISAVYSVFDAFGIDAFLPPSRARLNGQDCIKLNFMGSPMDIIINDQTKLIQAFQIADFMRITFSDYRDVQGVMMAYKTKVEIKPSNQTLIIEVESIEINSKLDAAKLEKPGN